MNTTLRLTAVSLLALGTSACTIHHSIREDYPEYLAKNVGESKLPTTDRASLYFLPAATRDFSYEFRSFVTGGANLWAVEFGKMLDDTLRSADVQAAFGSLKDAASADAPGNVLVFDLERYTFDDFAAHITLKVTLMRSGTQAFSKTYRQDGKSQGGKMFWGGAFAQRNAVQQSTKLALDEILRQLIQDLNALH